MKSIIAINILYLVFLTASCNTSTEQKPEEHVSIQEIKSECQISYKNDLKDVGNFFTFIESDPLLLSNSTVPEELKTYRGKVLKTTKLTVLKEMNSGYLINCELDYGYQRMLLCVTLSKDRCLKDYRFFVNGTTDFKYSDTISSVQFMNKGFVVEQMHLNQEEEPHYDHDGIRKFSFSVNEQLQIKNL